MSSAPTPQQQAQLKAAYQKLAKKLLDVERNFTHESITILKQLDEREQAELLKKIETASND